MQGTRGPHLLSPRAWTGMVVEGWWKPHFLVWDNGLGAVKFVLGLVGCSRLGVEAVCAAWLSGCVFVFACFW